MEKPRHSWQGFIRRDGREFAPLMPPLSIKAEVAAMTPSKHFSIPENRANPLFAPILAWLRLGKLSEVYHAKPSKSV